MSLPEVGSFSMPAGEPDFEILKRIQGRGGIRAAALDVDTVTTDSHVDPTLLDELRQLGVNIETAPA